MTKIGFTLSSEEQAPATLVEHARAAEGAGFDFLSISDHFHPWVDQQGQSPFVWGVLGAVSEATEKIEVITGVTCPTTRIHPAIVAQAAATAGCQLPGRFSLGVGSGENLNEHILGDRWPSVDVRQERLEEAVGVIRSLWEGGLTSHRGRHYEVENARIYTLPDQIPPILVATAGEQATELAGRVGDGLVGLIPDSSVIADFHEAGGTGKPAYGQIHICWGPDRDEAVDTALKWWPNSGVSGNLFVELPLPSHFEEASSNVDREIISEEIVCGPEPEPIIAEIDKFVEAGYSHVYVHQVGPDRPGFFDFFAREVLPGYREV